MNKLISISLLKPKNEHWQKIKALVNHSTARKFSEYLTKENVPHRSKWAESDAEEVFIFEYLKDRNGITVEQFIDTFIEGVLI